MKSGRWLIAISLGLVFSLLPLSGATYRSNSLGQPLELDPSGQSYYSLVVDEGRMHTNRALYEGGQLIMSEQITTNDDGVQEILAKEYNLSGELLKEVTSVYEDGLPQRIISRETGDLFMTLYAYADGRLIEQKELVNGELVRLTTYYRGEEGMLSGIRVVETNGGYEWGTFTKEGSYPLYGEQSGESLSTLTYYPHNLVVRNAWLNENWEVKSTVGYDEAGRLVVREERLGGWIKKYYGPDGMLVEQHEGVGEEAAVVQTFIYDPYGVLDHSVELVKEGSSERRLERWYKDGVLETQTEWVDTIPVKASRYLFDGTTVVTLFEDGRPYADVTYAPDGKRVLSLEYRKER